MKIDKTQLYYKPVLWVISFIKMNYQIDITSLSTEVLSIGTTKNDNIILLPTFYEDIFTKKIYNHLHHFKRLPLITHLDGRPDYVSSIFYLVNCIQEYDKNSNDYDKYNRFSYKASLQYRFDILEKDLVKEYVEKLVHSISPKQVLPQMKSRILISHDIDSVYGSLKFDSLNALKKMNISNMTQVIIRTIANDPPWFNMDKIAILENSFNIRACYYWIVSRGRDLYGIKNGDYNYSNLKIQKHIKIIKKLKNEIGLHKSTLNTTVMEESILIDAMYIHNRYHFLKFQIPEGLSRLESGNINSDSSLGYASFMGLRNSCAMPYFPFDIKLNRTIKLLELPLHIMDGMFNITCEEESNQVFNRLVSFIESHNSNAIISILWHNSELTEYTYKWSFHCYKKLLSYINESKIETVLPSDLYENYKEWV